MSVPRVHVIMATFNPSEYLWDQLNSILVQSNVEVTVSVFDDGSTDKSFLYLAAGLNDPRVRLFECESSGSAGRSFLRAVTLVEDIEADWFAYADQDDVWFPDKLSKGIDLANQFSASGYSSNLYLYDGVATYATLEKPGRQTEFDHYFQGASAGCTYILRADVFDVLRSEVEKLNIYSLSHLISHDWLTYFIVRKYNFRWKHDTRSFILYRQHSNNVYGAKRGFQGFLSKANLLFKGLAQENTAVLAKLCPLQLEQDSLLSRNTVMSRVLFIRNAFNFRREVFLSVVCFVLWVMGRIYPYKR